MSDQEWDQVEVDSEHSDDHIQLQWKLIRSEIKLNEQAELIEKLQADIERMTPDYERYSVLRNYKIIVKKLDELLPVGKDIPTRIKADYEAASNVLGQKPYASYLSLRRIYLSMCHPKE